MVVLKQKMKHSQVLSFSTYMVLGMWILTTIVLFQVSVSVAVNNGYVKVEDDGM